MNIFDEYLEKIKKILLDNKDKGNLVLPNLTIIDLILSKYISKMFIYYRYKG